MNLLDQATPAGVQTNTFRLRHGHVDLDGDGVPEALSPSAARTFRQFRLRSGPGHFGSTS
jgi:hypothetical protein